MPGTRQTDACGGRLAVVADDDMPLPLASMPHAERRIYADVTELPLAGDQRQVVLVDVPCAKRRVLFAECAATFGQDQAA